MDCYYYYLQVEDEFEDNEEYGIISDNPSQVVLRDLPVPEYTEYSVHRQGWDTEEDGHQVTSP